MKHAINQTSGDTYSTDQLAKAKVPMVLAVWYRTVGRKLTKLNVIDEIRLANVRSMVQMSTA